MTDFNLPHLTLVIGGASSGKSSFAEELINKTQTPRRYIATANAYDVEMEDKVAAHQFRRGVNWTTVEAPLDAHGALNAAHTGETVLLDCASMWLSNHMLAESNLEEEQKLLLGALQTCHANVVIVSNEVGAGIVPDNPLARQFRQAQGELNQALAAASELVITVIAGLPLVLKGTMPE